MFFRVYFSRTMSKGYVPVFLGQHFKADLDYNIEEDLELAPPFLDIAVKSTVFLLNNL